MDLRSADVRGFLEIIRTGNVSRAAERLGLTQPALTIAIHRIEESLGTQLLVRTRTGVHPTSAGIHFAAKAKDLLDGWASLRNDILRDDSEVSGRIVLGCHPSVALYTLPGVIPPLLKRHPRLELELFHDLSRHITERVISWEIDFGIVINPVKHPDLVIHELGRDNVTFWENSDNANRDVLVCDPSLLQTQELLKKASRAGIEFKRTITSSNLDVVRELTTAGAGVGILPTRVAKRSGKSSIRLFSAKAPTVEDRFCWVYRADAPKTLAREALSAAFYKYFQ